MVPSTSEKTRQGRDPTAEIIEAQSQLHEAFHRGDIRKLGGLLVSTGYVHTDIWGRVFNKGNWLEWVSENGPAKRDSSYKVSDVRVQVLGKVAVLTCLWTFRRVNEKPLAVRLTNVWAKDRSGWKRLTYQATLQGAPSESTQIR